VAATVPASEFTRNFGRYRMQAQREPVAVSSHGQVTGYFIGPADYEEFKRFQDKQRSFATVDLSDERIRAIAHSRMDPRHEPSTLYSIRNSRRRWPRCPPRRRVSSSGTLVVGAANTGLAWTRD
jgi:PHD/YefM family antitoxin component YafN of YafNO toxin-antitoxin module